MHFPSLALPLQQLAQLRDVDPNKYLLGLGCQQMALCTADQDVVFLAVEAARRALSTWSGRLDDIGLIAVGTETAKDMSRPLSAWVAEALGLSGAVRSYEVKHACYAGTLALRQALEWRQSGAAAGKAALVIASDIALYAEEDPGEPTQGAGAVAMVIDSPDIATVDLQSFPYSEPAFDFWRPVGEAHPRVDGKLSLECYCRAAEHCFAALESDLNQFAALCFHVPFPKMVKKAFTRVAERLGIDAAATGALYEQKVVPHMAWNARTGNTYTASLWTAVAHALIGRKAGERLTAFSYGSGFGAELLTLEAGPAAEAAPWRAAVQRDLETRKLIDAAAYQELRKTR